MNTSGISVRVVSSEYFPRVGGVQTHVHELTRALVQHGVPASVVTFCEMRFLNPRSWRISPCMTGDVPTLHIPLLKLPYRLTLPGEPARHALLQWSARRCTRRFQADGVPTVIHVHDVNLGDYFARHVTGHARLFTNHTSVFLQDVESGGGRDVWLKRLLKYAAVIAPSRELVQQTVAVGYPEERTFYIPNGVDVERFEPNDKMRLLKRKALGIPEEDVVILCARRIVPKNGVIDFAHSLRFLAGTNVTVLIAGNRYQWPDSSYESEVRGAMLCSRIADKVRYLGSVPNHEMHELYVAADLAVLPSLKEATSIAGLEAMASGLPLVATRVGGLPELIDDEVTGLLVEPGDPRGLGEAINQMIASAELRKYLGRNARERAVNEFNWRIIAVRTLDVYKRVLAEFSGESTPCNDNK
jgi:glycosyltransferase involved in cell wall biosynthesis